MDAGRKIAETKKLHMPGINMYCTQPQAEQETKK
jgi:hypothetical protein